jgi:hypothetical protein
MYLIVGCSHINHLNINNNFDYFICSGGSAKGLNNENSISGYGKKILEYLHKSSNDYDTLFFSFGGVDIDFSYIHKYLDDKKINFFEFNQNIISNYLKYITDHFSNKTVVVMSVGLPTLDDDNLKKGLLNGHINYLEDYDLQKLKKKLDDCNDLPNIYYRTQIVLNFNEQLKREIIKMKIKNIYYLDVTSFTYDSSRMRIKDEYFSRTDHHCYERNKKISKKIDQFCKSLLHKKS